MTENEIDNLIENYILDTDATKIYKSVNFKMIDWLENPFEHKSYCFLIQCMGYLVEVLEYDSSARGQKFVLDILSSWYQSVCRGGDEIMSNPILFHDHATAIRTRNLIKINNLLSNEEPMMQELLLLHAKKLLDEGFYNKGNNHGFDQSKALYEISFILNDKELATQCREVARSRITFEIHHMFCDDGMHKENSPAYLNYGISQVFDFLSINSQDKDKASVADLLSMIKKSFKILGFLSKPDGTLPLIGDTGFYHPRDFCPKKFDEVYHSVEYQNYLYCISKGKNGKKPTSDELFCPNGGYVVLRQFENRDFVKAFHFVFKCAHLSNFHRHDDDLGFVLAYDGEDWLIDGGLYSYAERDPYRIYFRSHYAHNISYPNVLKAHRNLQRSQKTGIAYFTQIPNGYLFEGVSYMFDYFESRRKIFYNKQRLILEFKDTCRIVNSNGQRILQEKIQNNEPTFVTNFLIPADKKIEVLESESLVKIYGKRKILFLSFSNFGSKVELLYGSDAPIAGFVSTKASAKSPCYCLRLYHFKKEQLDFDFILSFGKEIHTIDLKGD